MKFIKHKFNAKKTVKDDIIFSSKMEAAYYQKLKMLQQQGELLFFLRQVPFHLPGGVRYVVDFIEFYLDGEIKFVDVKGMDTPLSIAKRKLVEAHYPIDITIVSKVK